MRKDQTQSAESRFNDPNRIGIGEVAQRLCQIIKEVQQTQRRKLITRNGRVIAAICPLSEVAIVEEFIRAKGDHHNQQD